MADNRVKKTFGMREAMDFDVPTTLLVEIKLTRRFVWLVKLKYIWAIICA